MMRIAETPLSGPVIVWLLVVSGQDAFAATSGSSVEEAECGGPCETDPDCAREVASCFMARDEPRPALDALKDAYAAHPADGRLVRMMAVVYLEMGNTAWAIKRLLAHLDEIPDDLESRTWVVWLLVQQGDLQRAEDVLWAAADSPPGPLAARVVLLRAVIQDLRGDAKGAESAIRQSMRARQALHEEDLALLADLRDRVRGDEGTPISARVQVSGGYSSNAVQSSPTDPGTGGSVADTGSLLLGVDAVARFEPWTSRWIRPTGEARGKLAAFPGSVAMDYSFADLGARVGVDVGARGPHLLVGYDVEILAVHSGDAYLSSGPRWFMEAHRVEVEFRPVPQVQAFVGFGRRIYRELPRTRTELDGGVAGVFALGRGWHLTVLGSGRYQAARIEAYDAHGATVLVRWVVPLPRRAMVKAKLMGVWDRYPGSAGYYTDGALRNDVMGKVQAGPWSPSFHGLRVGLTYALTVRSSTIDAYSYVDHRGLLELRWEGIWDPWAPRVARGNASRIPLPYGLRGRQLSGLDRVQDLLRQEDAARRGSSCVD